MGDQTNPNKNDKGQDDNKGDKSKALKVERDKRKNLQAENERLRKLLESNNNVKINSDGISVNITEDQLMNASADEINAMINGNLNKFAEQLTSQLDGQYQSKQQTDAQKRLVDQALQSYEIFDYEEDPDISADALAAFREGYVALENKDSESVNQLAEKVSKRYSKYVVAKQDEKDGKKPKPPKAPIDASTKAAAAAHYQEVPEKPDTLDKIDDAWAAME